MLTFTTEGWALKGAKKAERFNEAQKSYLEAKFNIGQSNGKKLDPDAVAKEMRCARGPNGDRLFSVTTFLSAQQISSFFSRLAAKARQKEVHVTEQDALLYSQRQSAFVPQCHSPYCGRSVRLVCLGKKQGNKEAESGFAASPL